MAGNPYLWDTTPLNNQAADPDFSWAEGQLPGTVNNSARGMMAAEAGLLKDNNATLTTGGSANAYTVTSNIPVSGTPFSGMRLCLNANFTNTGAATLNLTPGTGGGSAWGAKSIRVISGGTDVALTGGEIQAGGFYDFVYNTSLNSSAGGWMLVGRAAAGFSTGTRLAKVANYTVANADKGKLLALGGTAFFTLTVSAASGYDANFAILVTNEDTGRGKSIAVNGLTTFILWPGQTIRIFNDNNTWVIDPPFQRWRMPAAGITFNVDVSLGNDANDGLATGSGNALATIQKAVDYAQYHVDNSFATGNTVIIQLADGTYTTGFTCFGAASGTTVSCDVRGNATTPANVVINVGAGGTCVTARDLGITHIRHMRLSSSGSGSTGISASQLAIVDFNNVEFHTMTAGTHMTAIDYAIINATGDYAITGNTGTHVAIFNGTVQLNGVTVTMAAARAFATAFLTIDKGVLGSGATFTGTGATTSTGTLFIVINGDYPHLTAFPGSVAGTAAHSADNGGVVGAPYYNFSVDPDTGVYRITTDNLGIACGGSKVLDAKTTGTAIIGTNTNDSAAAGWVGEVLETEVLVGSAVALTNNTAKTIATRSLTAGDWDVWGNVWFSVSVATQTVAAAINTTTDALPTAPGKGSYIEINDTSSTTNPGITAGQRRVSVSATTDVFLVAKARFSSGTVSAFGYIAARRAR